MFEKLPSVVRTPLVAAEQRTRRLIHDVKTHPRVQPMLAQVEALTGQVNLEALKPMAAALPGQVLRTVKARLPGCCKDAPKP